MRHTKKFTKCCKIPHSPHVEGNRAGRAEVIVSLLAASIYLAYKIYISCV